MINNFTYLKKHNFLKLTLKHIKIIKNVPTLAKILKMGNFTIIYFSIPITNYFWVNFWGRWMGRQHCILLTEKWKTPFDIISLVSKFPFSLKLGCKSASGSFTRLRGHLRIALRGPNLSIDLKKRYRFFNNHHKLYICTFSRSFIIIQEL